MKKIVSIAMVAAAVVFSACSSDDENPIDNNGTTAGMVLKATIEGQDKATRATMSGDSLSTSADNGKWTFAFDSGDKLSVSNSAAADYYTFSNTGDNFVSSDAKATAPAADWCAYFPGNDVSLASQDGKFEDVANCYALAGTTDAATTGADGIDITLKPQVAVLRVVKVENEKFGACDVNVRTADGKYVAGLTARKGEAAFDVKKSDSKVTLLSQTTPGVYYIAVPAGVKISIYNGDNLRNTTKDEGLTAGKYYTVLTGPITGTKEATIDGKTVEIGWVQMYPGGPKYATQNVAEKISWTEAAKTGKEYIWGANWRTPSKSDMNAFDNTTGILHTEQKVEFLEDKDKNTEWFKFTCTTPGYTKNVLLLPTEKENSANYWSSTEVETNKNNGWYISLVNADQIYGFWMGLSPKTSKAFVRPIVNE